MCQDLVRIELGFWIYFNMRESIILIILESRIISSGGDSTRIVIMARIMSGLWLSMIG
jgi:hypothetical protein